ncbi:MAG: ABC transporter substrate-binding protein [Halanaerobiaceae bacterium]
MKKRLLTIITSAILISLFVGAFSVMAADEEVTISFAWWGDTGRHEVYNSIVDMFEEEYPNINVERHPGSWNQYWTKLSTQAASGTAPDVIGMHPRYVADYASALLDLAPFVESGALDLYNVPESVRDTGFVDGTQYMISQGVTMNGYIYNAKTFDELGVEYPDRDWTYQEFAEKTVEIREAAEAKDMEMWGSADFSGLFIPYFAYYARSKGENAYTADGQLGFSEETVVEWFEFWNDLRENGGIPDAATGVEYTGLPLEQNLFNVGKVAINGIPANQIWLYQEQVTNGGDIHMVRMPHLADGQPAEYIEGAQFAITSGSDHPEAAAKLISFFINDKESQELFKLEQGVPPTTTAQEVITDSLSPADQRTVEFVSYALEMADSVPQPPTGSSEVIALFEEIAQAVAFGYQTPEEAAAEFIQGANDVLSMNN